VTVLEDVGYSDSGWIERELVRWFTAASCRVHLWEIGARLGGRYRRFTDKETAIINNVRRFGVAAKISNSIPRRFLVYTWIASWHENKSRRTTVRWELTSDDWALTRRSHAAA